MACLVSQIVVCAALLLTGRTGLCADAAAAASLPSSSGCRVGATPPQPPGDPPAPRAGAGSLRAGPQTSYRLLTSDCDTLVVALDATGAG